MSETAIGSALRKAGYSAGRDRLFAAAARQLRQSGGSVSLATRPLVNEVRGSLELILALIPEEDMLHFSRDFLEIVSRDMSAKAEAAHSHVDSPGKHGPSADPKTEDAPVLSLNAIAAVARPSVPVPRAPLGLAHREAMNARLAAFRSVKLHDGRDWSQVAWGELRTLEQDGELAKLVRGYAQPNDMTILVHTVVPAEKFTEFARIAHAK